MKKDAKMTNSKKKWNEGQTFTKIWYCQTPKGLFVMDAPRTYPRGWLTLITWDNEKIISKQTTKIKEPWDSI